MKEYLELRKQLSALTKYVKHTENCEMLDGHPETCTCGMVYTKKLARESLDVLGIKFKEVEARRGR